MEVNFHVAVQIQVICKYLYLLLRNFLQQLCETSYEIVPQQMSRLNYCFRAAYSARWNRQTLKDDISEILLSSLHAVDHFSEVHLLSDAFADNLSQDF